MSSNLQKIKLQERTRTALSKQAQRAANRNVSLQNSEPVEYMYAYENKSFDELNSPNYLQNGNSPSNSHALNGPTSNSTSDKKKSKKTKKSRQKPRHISSIIDDVSSDENEQVRQNYSRPTKIVAEDNQHEPQRKVYHSASSETLSGNEEETPVNRPKDTKFVQNNVDNLFKVWELGLGYFGKTWPDACEARKIRGQTSQNTQTCFSAPTQVPHIPIPILT